MKPIRQRWPDGMFERVQAVAGRRGVTDFTLAALELALKDERHPSQRVPSEPASGNRGRPPSERELLDEAASAPADDRRGRAPTPTFKCPRGCSEWRPSSDRARCPTCRQKVVPA